MTTQRWVEVLVVGIVLAGLGWLANTVFSMNAVLSRVESSTMDTTKRLDRIASVLPDVRVHVAEEELRKAVDLALACSTPFEHDKGAWTIMVHLFDFNEHEHFRYALGVDEPDGRVHNRVRHALRGAAKPPEEVAYFDQLIRWAHIADQELAVPASVDTGCSFVSRSRSREGYEEDLAHYRTVLTLFDVRDADRFAFESRSHAIRDLMALLKSEDLESGNEE
jgi:hypothetical protein